MKSLGEALDWNVYESVVSWRAFSMLSEDRVFESLYLPEGYGPFDYGAGAQGEPDPMWKYEISLL